MPFWLPFPGVLLPAGLGGVAAVAYADELRSPVYLLGVDARVSRQELARGGDVVDLGGVRGAAGVGEPAARVAGEDSSPFRFG